MSKKLHNAGGEYFTVYKSLGGMRSQASDTRTGTCAYTENMYRDYCGDHPDAVESIPGFRSICALGARINAIYAQKCAESDEYLIVHAGDKLFRFNIAERDSLGELAAIANIKDGKSHAFFKSGTVFISDGEKILRINGHGEVTEVGDGNGTVYVPTAFKNGQPYEQRNLLTRRVKEIYTLTERDRHFRESKGLKYELSENGTCSLIGAESVLHGAVYIPKYAAFGNKYYRITEIADGAFAKNTNISAVYIADGLTRIGKLAFNKCTALTAVYCPSTVELIDNGAFLDCTALTDVFIGKKLTRLGTFPFSGASSLESVKFEADEITSEAVENISALGAYDAVYSAEHPRDHYAVPVSTVLESVTDLTLAGESIPFDAESLTSDGLIFFSTESTDIPEGREAVIYGQMPLGGCNTYECGTDFATRSGTDTNIIEGCTCSAVFDGRIFLGGNPKYPNTVFYSLECGVADALYFGSLSYFDDGSSAYGTVSISKSSDALTVLKSSDDGGGGIFYHEGKDQDAFLQRTYPVTSVHTGIGARGASLSFMDEVFFLNETGVCSLKYGNYKNRYASCKSRAVNAQLLKNSSLDAAHIVPWLGYVAIQIGPEIYLADAERAASDGTCDWYYLSGIGTYSGQRSVYKYMSFAPQGYSVHADTDAEATGDIYMTYDAEYGNFFYERDAASDKKYAVYMTGETRGGTFSPASGICSVGSLLFFGTESGDICVFNNDRRGIAPNALTSLADFDPEEYRQQMGNRIHSDHYDFCGRTPHYALKSAADDCGIPYFRKSTVGGSLCVRAAAVGGKSIKCELISDGEYISSADGLSSARPSFLETDFSAFSFDCADEFYAPVTDAPKNWMEQQICISSDEFRSPLCIGEISYRFRIKGKMTRK